MSTIKSDNASLILNADGASSDLKFQSNGTDKLVLNSSGNLGIGNNSPGSYDAGARHLVIGSPSEASLGMTIASSTNGTIYWADGTTGDEAYRGAISYNHASDHMLFRTGGFNERLRITSDGNVGIGVVPYSDWSSNHTALQIGGNGSIMGDTSPGAGTQTNYTHNARWDGTNWIYISADEASKYYQNNGRHVWEVTGSGSANAAISWTTGMTVQNDGNVGIGITSPGIIAGGTRYLTTGTQSANAAGFFELVGNRTANASQDVAIIKFINNTTQIAEIGAYDNGSTNGGDLKFFTSSGGTTTERLSIKSDGRGLSQFTAKAWCSLNGNAGSGSQIQDSHNVSSTTDNGTGDITITFSNSLANTNYTAAGMVPGNVPTRGGMWISFAYGNTSRTTSYLRVNTGYHSNAEYDGAVYDVNPVTVQVFGD